MAKRQKEKAQEAVNINVDVKDKAKAIQRALSRPDRGFVGQVMFSMRRRILTGTLLMIPIVISFFPVVWLYPKLDAFAQTTMKERIPDYPGLGFAVALLLVLSVLYIVGVLATTFIVRWAVLIMEKVLNQVPVVNFLYKTTKQVVELFNEDAPKPFQKVVWIEYPRKGIHALAFVTGEGLYPGRGHIVHIFVPTTPNPTSGFLLLLPAEDVVETNLSVDQAFQFIISGGILEMGPLELKPYQSDSPKLLDRKEPPSPLISSEA